MASYMASMSYQQMMAKAAECAGSVPDATDSNVCPTLQQWCHDKCFYKTAPLTYTPTYPPPPNVQTNNDNDTAVVTAPVLFRPSGDTVVTKLGTIGVATAAAAGSQ